ncbi:MAG: 2OG-Fe(II) oxygenase [Pararhodobacter sp.]|nr:2OG-Fe(II) oxygenase [Pararhodobacter sp.]
MLQYHQRLPGDPLPHVTQRTAGKERFNLGAAAGRYIVICLLGPSANPALPGVLLAAARRDVFNDSLASLFLVSTDPEPTSLPQERRGFRVFLDHDLKVSRALGAAPFNSEAATPYRPLWIIADPMLRIIETLPAGVHDTQAVLDRIERLPPPERATGIALQAPVLYLPRVFEPELCAELIDRYEAAGGEISGFMREVDGKTVGLHDPNFKSRRDHIVTDPGLIEHIQGRIVRRVVPEIQRAHAFHPTRMERYIVSCYRADEGGHFAAHRDNTTPGTAHRRFAVSINLNDAFEGGEVSFPEFGPQGFRAPPGGAVVFSCSLLHRVSAVTSGARYAFLPFLYDDAAAALRQKNLHTVTSDTEAAQ